MNQFQIICEIISGSHLYGTNQPDSDYDYVGVVIPPLTTYFTNNHFEQFNSIVDAEIYAKEGKYQEFKYRFENPKNDRTLYSINKAVKLCADNNPNMMDLLYAPEQFWKHMDPRWYQFIDNRHLFLSKKCKHTFLGYAQSQLARLKAHMKWTKNPPVKPERKELGLSLDKKWYNEGLFANMLHQFKSEIVNKLSDMFIEKELVAPSDNLNSDVGKVLADVPYSFFATYVPGFFLSVAKRYLNEEKAEELEGELAYFFAMKNWREYEQWKTNRNPKRYATEEKHGYDTKHGGHLIRLLLMAEEILEKHTITLPLKQGDRELVMSIRDGAFTYDKLIELSQAIIHRVERVYETSTLQKGPERQKIDEILYETLYEHTKGDIV